MKITIETNKEAKELTIRIEEVDWEKVESGSFAAGEESIQDLLCESGRALTKQLLESKDVDAAQLECEGRKWYRKKPSEGHYQTLYGPISVRRHSYQTSDGGSTMCPLEEASQMSFGTATPLLAKVLAFKFSSMTSREIRQDLMMAHGTELSCSFIDQTGQRVGEIAVAKARSWILKTDQPATGVATIAIGVDGTTMPLVGEDYKEAMCGTIALYDGAGERLSTQYLGAMPESGKGSFRQLVLSRVAAVTAQHPQARQVCLGDGAAWNWQLFADHYPHATWILDFYHAAQHLSQAADAIFGTAPSEAKSHWYEHLYLTLRDHSGGVADVIRTLISERNGRRLTRAQARSLDVELNYFRSHADKMHYANYVAAGFPIGSGVTEAGCKELIKARFCRSGMSWRRESGAKALNLRAIRLSNQWNCFWQKVIRYAA